MNSKVIHIVVTEEMDGNGRYDVKTVNVYEDKKKAMHEKEHEVKDNQRKTMVTRKPVDPVTKDSRIEILKSVCIWCRKSVIDLRTCACEHESLCSIGAAFTSISEADKWLGNPRLGRWLFDHPIQIKKF